MFHFSGALFWRFGLLPQELLLFGYTLPLTLSLFRLTCDGLLADADAVAKIRSRRYDVAVMDLVGSQCALALAEDMGVPVVGFWASSPVGMELEASGRLKKCVLYIWILLQTQKYLPLTRSLQP